MQAGEAASYTNHQLEWNRRCEQGENFLLKYISCRLTDSHVNQLSKHGFSVLVIEAGKNLPDHPAIIDAERLSELKDDPATDCNWHYDAIGDNGTVLPVKIDSGKFLVALGEVGI